MVAEAVAFRLLVLVPMMGAKKRFKAAVGVAARVVAANRDVDRVGKGIGAGVVEARVM